MLITLQKDFGVFFSLCICVVYACMCLCQCVCAICMCVYGGGTYAFACAAARRSVLGALSSIIMSHFISLKVDSSLTWNL